MRALLLRVGRGRTAWAEEAARDYARRLPAQLELEEQLIKPEPFGGDVEKVRQAEGLRLLEQLREGDRLITLDERGQLIRTEELSAWVDQSARQSTRRLIFAIGGPYGHAPALRERAWKTLALSPMVLNHELARVLIIEQLYRVSTLLWGGSYHH